MAQPKSFLEVEGIFNPLLRFAFTNITEEMFVSAWDGSPINVPAGKTIEVPHHLAVKFTKELVDKIMIGNAKLDEVTKNQPYYRSPQGSSLGVPAARKVWEDKIIRQLAVDEESPEIQIMRSKIREELMSDMKREPASSAIPVPSMSEFAEVTNKQDRESKVVEKKPLKMKEIK